MSKGWLLVLLPTSDEPEDACRSRPPRLLVLLSRLAIMSGLVFCGWLVFVMPGELESHIGPKLHYLFALQLLVVAINIHHFFVDGTIWKISNPEVRRTLFAHLEPT